MRGKNRKKRPSRPQSWINGGKVDGAVSVVREQASPIPVKVGGDFSFTVLSAEIGLDTLEIIWNCKTMKSIYLSHNSA